MFRKFRINSIFIALLMVFAVATDVLAARPTNPADWPAVKDVYTDYFLIGNTSLSAANFGANVVPGENSDAAMTLKHFNIVTPDNAMKPDSLWGAGITGPTPSFLTNLTSGINNDISSGQRPRIQGQWAYDKLAQPVGSVAGRQCHHVRRPMGNSVGLCNGKGEFRLLRPNGRRAFQSATIQHLLLRRRQRGDERQPR